MKHLLYLVVMICGICEVGSVSHPVVLEPRVISCHDTGPPSPIIGEGPCSTNVLYASNGTMLVDIPELAPPRPDNRTTIMAVGVDCARGNGLTGKRFSGCVFTDMYSHTPRVLNCALQNTQHWDLTPESTCHLDRTTWGGAGSHAGPGFSCVIFVQEHGWRSGSANSIYGLLDPNVVANSGNTYCQKATPPSPGCDVRLPDTIDHGTITSNQHSSTTVEGTIECGAAPVVSFAGGGRITMAPGVTTELSARVLPADRIQITSNLVSVNGEAGQHTATTLILVSPY